MSVSGILFDHLATGRSGRRDWMPSSSIAVLDILVTPSLSIWSVTVILGFETVAFALDQVGDALARRR